MKPQPNRTQSRLILTAMAGIAAAYAYYFYLPNSREITRLQDQLAEAEHQAEQTFPIIAAIDATQKQLDAAVQYVQTWEEAAPSEDELAEVFEKIHKLTRLAETETSRFEPQQAVNYETFLRMPVSMECHGRFAQLAAVLAGLEHMQEPVWIQSIDFESTGEDSDSVHVQLSLDVFADNLKDSDQENLSGKPITQEADPPSVQVERSGIDL